MPELVLEGCRTLPLMAALKALAVLREADRACPGARLAWRPDGVAVLHSDLDEDGLLDHFMDTYVPSPLVSPWNKGSGIYTHIATGEKAITLPAVEVTEHPRLAPLRATIAQARALVADMAGDAAPTEVPDKDALLARWRAEASDRALEWLDACAVLRDEGVDSKAAVSFSPLLGSGGNDGNTEYARLFVQALPTALPHLFTWVRDEPAWVAQAVAHSRARLRWSLFERGELPPLATRGRRVVAGPGRSKGVDWLGATVAGQFNPGQAGLPNDGMGRSDSRSWGDVWDLVLLLEGALLFGGGVARRGDASGAVFPFTHPGRGVTRVGGATAGSEGSALRGETWLPVWYHPATLASVRRLLAEGRMQDGSLQAQTGLSGHRAAAALGVERGLAHFERVVYAQRFGNLHVATPSGRVEVRGNPRVAHLRSADRWLDRVRGLGGRGVADGLARVRVAAARAAGGGRAELEAWLCALAELELVVSRHRGARDARNGVRPLGPLSAEVAVAIYDPASIEHELARALAATGRRRRERTEAMVGLPVANEEREAVLWAGLRGVLEPVRARGRRGVLGWDPAPARQATVGARAPQAVLTTLAERQADVVAPPGGFGTGLAEVAALIDEAVDLARVLRLAVAYALCEPLTRSRARDGAPRPERGPAPTPDRLYAATRLVAGPAPVRRPGQPSPSDAARSWPGVEAGVVPLLAAGRGEAAMRAALRRLRSSQLPPWPSLDTATCAPDHALRVAVALAVPITDGARDQLAHAVLSPVADGPEMAADIPPPDSAAAEVPPATTEGVLP